MFLEMDNSTAATTTATTSTAGTPEPSYHSTTTPWVPTHSTAINPSHSVPVISQASIPPTTATAGLPNPTHPGIFDDPAGIPWDSPTHTLPYRRNLAQPVCRATGQHIPPLVFTELVRYSHNSTSSSIKFSEQQHFSELRTIPRQISRSPPSTDKAPVQQIPGIRPQPTPTAAHPRPTVPVQRIRTQTPTEPFHSANDDDKSHITDLPEYYQLQSTHTPPYGQPTPPGPSTVPYNNEDPFLGTHDPFYRQIGPRRYPFLFKVHPSYHLAHHTLAPCPTMLNTTTTDTPKAQPSTTTYTSTPPPACATIPNRH